MNESLKVTVVIDAPLEKVWDMYTLPEHIVCWNNASDDWHTVRAENDLRSGGKFLSRMESKDGKEGFDYEGEYEEVIEHALIKSTLTDNRKVVVKFTKGIVTRVDVTFDREYENTPELQTEGWQAILNNFKKYVESQETNKK